MKYSIIIPTYNKCDQYLKPCIDSILKHSNMDDVELIISANGCVDNSFWYLTSLKNQFDSLGFGNHLKVVWSDAPLGYAGANNVAIQVATCDKIILLNNDTLLLDQPKNQWLDLLDAPFKANEKCGISCIIKGPSEPAGRDFAVFFCVMVHRKVFDKIGLLNTEYGVGGGEDTEFCIEAEKAAPIFWRKGSKKWRPRRAFRWSRMFRWPGRSTRASRSGSPSRARSTRRSPKFWRTFIGLKTEVSKAY